LAVERRGRLLVGGVNGDIKVKVAGAHSQQ
jgi:hypothetical protein